MKNILITGANGQLGLCTKDLTALSQENHSFTFVNRDELDITNAEVVNSFFSNNNIDYCVNCAAYTAVDKAENDEDNAKLVNEIGAKNLAEVCKNNDVTLIHISTDFVFDGKNSNPYKETDEVNPSCVYGRTKLAGELAIPEVLDKFFIIRTSWLYSEYGSNYLKTMLKLGEEKKELNIIWDQIGTPTYAGDLAKVILKIISNNNKQYGIYHYSNEGVASWYDFTKAIFSIRNISTKVNAIKTEQYQQDAKRPAYSVLDKHKIKETIKIEVPYWRESLEKVISKIGG